MGNHPSHSIEFIVASNNPQQVFATLAQTIQGIKEYELEESNEQERTLAALFYSPGCQMVDAVYFRVEDTDQGNVIVVASSRSTNVLPNWVPGRLLCSFYGGFSDFGRNKANIDFIMKKANLNVTQVREFHKDEVKKNN